MADLKRGTEVEVKFRGKMVGRPVKGLGVARVSVDTSHGKMWAVVSTDHITEIESEDQ